MADNQTIHNGATGSGTAFDAVADEITSPYTGGSAKAQGVKILSGTANSNEVIEGTAANGLEVDVTRLPRGATAFTDPTCDTSADLVLAANSDRISALIVNGGSVKCWLGPSGVTTSSGIPLEPGASLADTDSTSAWYGITAAGTADLRVCEVS